VSSRWITALIAAALLSVVFFGSAVSQATAVEPAVKLGVFLPDPQLPDEQLPSIDDLHDARQMYSCGMSLSVKIFMLTIFGQWRRKAA
jgi:hypothetical protein